MALALWNSQVLRIYIVHAELHVCLSKGDVTSHFQGKVKVPCT